MTQAVEPVILVEKRGAVAVVSFNRPDVMNAVTPEMTQLYIEVMKELEADRDVRAIVLTGKGRGFCAGADLGVVAGGAEAIDEIVPDADGMPNLTKLMSKPVIAAVNGAVAGIGYAFMMGTDVRFIAKEAKIATTFARLGLVAEYGLSWTLPRVVGTGRAFDLLLSGRAITGEDAVAYGLAEFAVPRDELLDAAIAYAEDLVQNCSPTSMAIIKRQIVNDLERGEREALVETMLLMHASFRGQDLVEAVAARQAKRPPAFPPVS
ncbi:MAG TPA: enoyl-CoA hydratase-related protein [Jatrophihabitans sp.]